MKAAVLVCCHKKGEVPSTSPFLPIHVGKALSQVELDMLGDNSGNNISEKNSCYCELTGVYWAWKNLKTLYPEIEVIGLSHYRRFFDTTGKISRFFPISTPSNLSIKDIEIPEEFISKVKKGTVVLAKPIVYPYAIHNVYCNNCISDDFHTLRLLVNETQEEKYKQAFFKVMYNNNKHSPFNMFIMSWQDFDNYCSWLFPLLAKVEASIDITHYNQVQKRIFGYMGEYLLNVWVEANHMKKIYRPVIWFNDKGNYWNSGTLRYLLRTWANNLAMQLTKVRTTPFRQKR